ncbi:MAG TPA: hypothetical protein DHN33_11935, partial [Eubacteriaceae bacterium]|nr:hypothetical protein [Eubacteriaceae bacterium]
TFFGTMHVEAEKSVEDEPAVNFQELAWPTPEHDLITSPYGYRTHPIYGYERFHTGIDISVGGQRGVDALAVGDGEVIGSTYMSGYGNTVIVNLGENDEGIQITALYAHLASRYVSVGQEVNAGTPIGEVGTTGAATGVHLHFEIRENGSPVDPLLWVSPEKEEIYEAEISLALGLKYLLKDWILPENLRDQAFAWQSLEEDIITVDSKGEAEARSEGSTKIQVFNESETVIAELSAVVGPSVAEIRLSGPDSVEVGEEAAFGAEILPEDAIDQSIEWKVLEDVKEAVIDQEGIFRSEMEGDYTIEAKALDGTNVTGIKKIKVESVDVVQVEDVEAERYLRNYLDLDEKEKITRDDLLGITSLDFANEKITDYSFLDEIPNLEEVFFIDSYPYEDLSILKNLTKLKRITIMEAPLKDISDIETLKELEYAAFYKTNIQDPSKIQTLENLKSLEISYNEILLDFSFLREMSSVETLRLQKSYANKDLSVLRNLTKLSRLGVGLSPLSDIKEILALKELEHLELVSTSISDVSVLRELERLKDVEVRGHEISNYQPLYDLRSESVNVYFD